MPTPRIVTLYPRPVIDDTLQPGPRGDGFRRTAQVAVACALGCVLLALVAALCVPQARASEPQPPPVDVPALLGELDRLHEAIWPVEVEVCRRHAGGRCLR